MKNSSFFFGWLVLPVLCFFASQAMTQTVLQWRGENRRGVYPGDGNLPAWPAGGPDLLWSFTETGDGYGSPVCAGDKIYICGTPDSVAVLYVLDRKGGLMQKKAYGKDWTLNYVGSRNAPTITDNHIYLSTGLGSLYCLERETLKEVWHKDGKNDLHGILPLFGHAESPAILGDLVFFCPGGRDTNVVALNRFTGKLVWVCQGDGERPGYNSPLVIDLEKRSVLVTFSAYSLMGIDAGTGKLLWTHPQDNIPPAERKPGNGDTHSNTVWYDNGALYYIAGDGNGAVRLILEPDGSGIRQVWRNKAVDNYMGGFIKLGNTIYSASDSKKSLYSMNITTGAITDTLKCGSGTVISDGRMLYYYNQRGEVYLIEPGKEGMRQVSSFKITQGTKEHFAHPVLDRGVLYIRHGRVLMAYKAGVLAP